MVLEAMTTLFLNASATSGTASISAYQRRLAWSALKCGGAGTEVVFGWVLIMGIQKTGATGQTRKKAEARKDMAAVNLGGGKKRPGDARHPRQQNQRQERQRLPGSGRRRDAKRESRVFEPDKVLVDKAAAEQQSIDEPVALVEHVT